MGRRDPALTYRTNVLLSACAALPAQKFLNGQCSHADDVVGKSANCEMDDAAGMYPTPAGSVYCIRVGMDLAISAFRDFSLNY